MVIKENHEHFAESVQPKNKRKVGLFFLFVFAIFFSSLAFYSGMLYAVRNDVATEFAKKDLTYLGKITGKYSETPDGLLSQNVDFGLFWEVWQKLEDIYVDKDNLNEKKMFYGALKGLASSLGDPYTVFMDPIVAKEFTDDLAGAFEGIGAEIGIKNEILTIVAPLPDMPAEKAGLKAGDKVYAIDGESTSGLSIDEAVRKIRGPKDTNVVLTIYRDEESPQDISVTRGTIVIKSVRTTLRDDKIFVIKITNFNDDTEQLFNDAVKKAMEESAVGIILDLRNNPGGYLDTAIEMASEWIENDIVVVEKFSEEKKNEYLSRGRARIKDMPTVVLINEGSASASEIVAGALQDKHKAKLVGKQSFGKGSVQTLEKFSDGSSLKVTIAKWLTPSGRSINDEGVMPDYVVDYTLVNYQNNEDPQFDKAVDLILSGEAVNFDLNPEIKDDVASTTNEIIE